MANDTATWTHSRNPANLLPFPGDIASNRNDGGPVEKVRIANNVKNILLDPYVKSRNARYKSPYIIQNLLDPAIIQTKA